MATAMAQGPKGCTTTRGCTATAGSNTVTYWLGHGGGARASESARVRVIDQRLHGGLRDEGLVDLEFVRGHLLLELVLDRVRHVVLLPEGLIKEQRGQLRAHHVGHVGVDLHVHVRELVHLEADLYV